MFKFLVVVMSISVHNFPLTLNDPHK